jgi:type I restriction enzyme M protein
VGAAAIEDDGEPFEEKMERLAETLANQFAKAEALERTIQTNLARIGFGEMVDKQTRLPEDQQ